MINQISKKNFRLVMLVLLPAVVVLAGLWLFRGNGQDLAPSQTAPRRTALPEGAQTVLISRVPTPAWVEAVGVIRPVGEMTISAQIQAMAMEVLVRSGQEVRRGELLLTLDDRELRARLAQGRHETEALESAMEEAEMALEAARAGLDLASAEYERISALHDKGASATSELDHSRTRFLQARAEAGQAEQALSGLRAQLRRAGQLVEELLVALGHTRINASQDGTIAQRNVEPGDVVRPGQTLFLLLSRQMHLEVQVPERFHESMATGSVLTARVDVIDREFETVVAELEPSATADSRTFLVKLSLERAPPETVARIQPGMFGRVQIPLSDKQTILIPREAILRVGQLEMAAVVHEGGVYSLRHLRLGRPWGDMIEVLSGLEGGETVWLHPIQRQ
ncbi:efflux RND transporter periplasmic adaptor subunit [Desulfonatronum thiosulfatophilum]|nr:efflux RND transporter periplasmic adaptor subunit [Desulfonatronum thiosulfatophilum]